MSLPVILTDDELESARQWIEDCMNGGEDFDDPWEDLTDLQVQRMVNKYYDGGLDAFRHSSNP